MTLVEMRSMLRRRIDDTHSRRWSDADIDDELTFAMRLVVKEVSTYQLDNTLVGFAIAQTPVDGQLASDGTTVVPANFQNKRASTGILMVDLIRPVSLNDGRFVDIPEFEKYPLSKDDSGLWVASIIRGFDDVKDPATNNPIGPLSTFDLIFNKTFDSTTDVGSFGFNYVAFEGLSATGDVYSTMDENYQELAVIRAALMLIGSDNANFDFLRQAWNDGYAKLKSSGAYRLPQNTAMPVSQPQAVPFGDGVPA